MRKEAELFVNDCIERNGIRGDVLEIGAYTYKLEILNDSRFTTYTNLTLDIGPTEIENTVIGDITECSLIPESYDFILAIDVMEHINMPWIAAENIIKLLRPGGYVIVAAPWAWRYHPCPIDYWRFSPEALKFLFNKLQTIECGFDDSIRRMDIRSFWENGLDAVPVDELGGWRENWTSYYVGKKIN